MPKKDHFKYPEKLAMSMLAALKADMAKLKKKEANTVIFKRHPHLPVPKDNQWIC
jgi:hypothetical protein